MDATNGNDSGNGLSTTTPWMTIKKAVQTVIAGDTIYVRGGEYNGIKNGWVFQNSGTQAQPITFTNYPGEQVVLKITNASSNEYEIFRCMINPHDLPSWATPKADYIKIIGTDVSPHILSNGVESKKGIVIQGMEGEQSKGITAGDCDCWEVAGVDFIEVSSGIFTFKNNWQTMEEHSTDNWYVHNNRVYNFYRESGMQFNGDYNRIENNEIYKVSHELYTPHGCQLLNINGHHNVIKGNVLSRLGSTANCVGIRFEWDLADMNIVEQNLIDDVSSGINIDGGDNNIIRNNLIYITSTPLPYRAGIMIHSYDNTTTSWPCSETVASGAQALLPANNPAHPDYQYYYNPRNCHSYGNQVYNNTIHGFDTGIRLYPLIGENIIIRNNVFSGWTRGGICFYEASNGTCKPLPTEVTADHNITQGPFGFVDIQHFDFNLSRNSPLIDSGYNLGSLNLVDFNGNVRPQGIGFDIGVYEFIRTNHLSPPSNFRIH
ncbi:choice-of-anchor Q domain-containing protein [Calditrichota bacterium]